MKNILLTLSTTSQYQHDGAYSLKMEKNEGKISEGTKKEIRREGNRKDR